MTLEQGLTEQAQRLKKDTTAVSELIGYVFVFSALLTTVVFLSLAGAPIIDDAQDQESTISMEHNFIYLNDQIETVNSGVDRTQYQGHFPAGQFQNLDATEIEFEQEITGEENPSISVETQPLEYQTENGANMLYDARFVTLKPSGETVDSTHMRHQPVETGMNTNPVINIPAIEADEVTGFSSTSSTNVAFDIEKTDRGLPANSEVFHAGEGAVTVTVDSEIPNAWEAHLESHEAFTDVSENNGDVTAQIDFDELRGDRLTVTYDEIDLSFD